MRKFDARQENFRRCAEPLHRNGPSRRWVPQKWHVACCASERPGTLRPLRNFDRDTVMGQVIYFVEPESHGARWHIKRGGRIRATYTSRAQAIMDARQLASFENELRGAAAIVRVLDPQRAISEDLVCTPMFRTSAPSEPLWQARNHAQRCGKLILR